MTDQKDSLFRLLRLVKPHTTLLVIGMVGLVIGSGINLLIPELIRRVIDHQQARLLTDQPGTVALALIALFAVQALFFFTRSYCFGVIGQKSVASLRQDLYQATLSRAVSFFDQQRTGDLVSRINADCQLIQDAVSIKISVLIRYTLQVLIGVLLMSLISLRLTGALLLVIPVITVFSIVLGKKLKRLSRSQQESLGDASTIAEETFGGVRVVKAFSQEPYERSRFNETIIQVLNFGIQRAQVAAFFASFVNFLMNACIVAVMVYGVSLVTETSLSYGDLTAFLLYGVIVAVSFAFISGAYAEISQAAGASSRVFELIDHPPVAATRGTPLALPDPVRGDVEFKNVDFCYPSRAESAVLQSVSFTLRSGSVTALVGPSGSGKTTIANLLLRFYDPDQGSITLDGIDLRDILPEDLRRVIAIVPQDPQLFAVSIGENIRYGNPDASSEEVAAVCVRARVSEFVDSLDQGLDTLVGDRGIQLSGGQKQRVAIARAMLRNPRLLILDEATSSLDSHNEALVQEALAELMVDRTALVIAHRLSTVKDANQALVLRHGQLVQQGTHSSLIEQEGLYRELVERQELIPAS